MDGLLIRVRLETRLAWDIYDENTETLSGSWILHDTVGIWYQTTQDVGVEAMESLTVKNPIQNIGKEGDLKRTLDVDGKEEEEEEEENDCTIWG